MNSTKLSFTLGCAFLLWGGMALAQWRPVPGRIASPWAEQVRPDKVWEEYPRPQLVREEWENLNGLWDYAIVEKGQSQPSEYQGKILVPFSVESSLSGVGKSLLPGQELWYRRNFDVPQDWKGKQLRLHFGAVDWQATVYVNGRLAGEHKGGNDPFSFDITEYLAEGRQELVVKVWDPTDSWTQPRGKQVLDPRGIWYTAVSGIWQTVWLEPLSVTSIEDMYPVPDIDKGEVSLHTRLSGVKGGEELEVRVFLEGKEIQSFRRPYSPSIRLALPSARLWSPGSPTIYTLKLELRRKGELLDQADSYFAMRKISLCKDARGTIQLCLNNEPLFQWGVLDQGWWPGGLLTPPSDEAMKYDMEVVRDLGFNMIRKHVKVEPARYYFHADTMGLLVWQDMPSGFNRMHDSVQHVKADAEKDWDRPEDSAKQFEAEWKSIIDHFRFFPSIVVWVPFNEGWGQYDTRRISEWTQRYDPSRLVDAVSGWTDRNTGHMYDAHQYPGPSMEPIEQHPGRAMVLGEFGGLGLPVKGHLWSEEKRNWGYRTYTSQDEFMHHYRQAINNLKPLIARGMAGAIYTQTSDVEGEVNGFLTYDRKVLKVPGAEIRELHRSLFEPLGDVHFLIRDSELESNPLYVSKTEPGKGWNERKPGRKFERVQGPLRIGKGESLWSAREFRLEDIPAGLAMKLYAQGQLKISLNGQLVYDKRILTKRHYDEVNLSEFAGYLKKGKNIIALELKDAEADSDFDFGLYRFSVSDSAMQVKASKP